MEEEKDGGDEVDDERDQHHAVETDTVGGGTGADSAQRIADRHGGDRGRGNGRAQQQPAGIAGGADEGEGAERRRGQLEQDGRIEARPSEQREWRGMRPAILLRLPRPRDRWHRAQRRGGEGHHHGRNSPQGWEPADRGCQDADDRHLEGSGAGVSAGHKPADGAGAIRHCVPTGGDASGQPEAAAEAETEHRVEENEGRAAGKGQRDAASNRKKPQTGPAEASRWNPVRQPAADHDPGSVTDRGGAPHRAHQQGGPVQIVLDEGRQGAPGVDEAERELERKSGDQDPGRVPAGSERFLELLHLHQK